MTRQRGFSLIEILIVLAILGVIAGIVAVNGRRLLTGQEERASVGAVQQLLLQGGTGAASRNETVELRKSGRTLSVVNTANGRVIAKRELPSGVSFELQGGAVSPGDGVILSFSPSGKLSPASLAAVSPIKVTTATNVYLLELSVIGEVEVISP